MISAVSAGPGYGVPFSQRTNTPLVVLLVADNPAEADRIAASLAEATADDSNHEARPQLVRVTSIAAARTHLRRYQVDVVLLDLALADDHGPTALYRLRATSPDVPVVLMSDVLDVSLAHDALHAGAQDVLMKPLPDGKALGRALRFAVERHELVSELETAVRASALVARRWKLLADAATALATGRAGAGETRFRVLGKVLVPDAADCFVLVVGNAAGGPGILEVSHVNAAQAAELQAQLSRLVESRLARPARSPDTGSSSNLNVRDAIRSALAGVGMESTTIVALPADAHQWGFLALSAAKPRWDTVTDEDFANFIADRVAAAMEGDHLMHELQRAVAARDRAVSIVSHDLRSPLSTIQICATALLDPAPAPTAGVRQMADLIHRSTVWMQGIVQDLLDRTALDSGQVALHRQATSVHEIVTTAQVMFAPLAEEQAIDFVVESENGVPDIDADPHRLLQVLSNLISNAMKVTPKGGRVAVAARATTDSVASRKERGNAVRFTVSDNGPGIPSENLAHVFDWFWHSPKTGSDTTRTGKGLGLAIAKGLVEAHHARLNVESKVGQGSTFWFSIPVAEPATERMASAKDGPVA